MKTSLKRILLLCLALTLPALAEDPGHEGHAEGDAGHEEGIVTMNVADRDTQGIKTARVARRLLTLEITAPGEVVTNAYQSAQVTPRITAQVVERHARLGDEIKMGQPLVTLSSVEMADAQGELVVADREWQRVKKLGKKVISERRYIEAQVARQQAYARARAYGMTEARIDTLLKQDDVSRATGSFDLLSPQDGIIISDEFVIGEVIEPGRVLFNVTDESTLWVEAKLRPEDAVHITLDSPVRVSVDGKHWSTGKVIQRYHRLDETTRTQSVRIEVDNRDDLLHAGQFVDVALQAVTGDEVIAVPEESVVLMEGTPTVFKVEGDELRPQSVETGTTHGGWTEIRSGLPAGEEMVVKGVFLLKSLLLKSRMGEGHVH